MQSSDIYLQPEVQKDKLGHQNHFISFNLKTTRARCVKKTRSTKKCKHISYDISMFKVNMQHKNDIGLNCFKYIKVHHETNNF